MKKMNIYLNNEINSNCANIDDYILLNNIYNKQHRRERKSPIILYTVILLTSVKGELSSCQNERGKFWNPGNCFAPVTIQGKHNYLCKRYRNDYSLCNTNCKRNFNAIFLVLKFYNQFITESKYKIDTKIQNYLKSSLTSRVLNFNLAKYFFVILNLLKKEYI